MTLLNSSVLAENVCAAQITVSKCNALNPDCSSLYTSMVANNAHMSAEKMFFAE